VPAPRAGGHRPARLTKPIDPTGELARALERYAATPIDDEEELPIEKGFDREPGDFG
jgi:hypothetical protein